MQKYSDNNQQGSTVAPEDFLLDLGEGFLKGFWDEMRSGGLTDQAIDSFWESHPRSEGYALLGLAAGGALLGAEYYLNNNDPDFTLKVPIPKLEKDWECGGGTFTLWLELDLELKFDGSLLNPDVDSYGFMFGGRFTW